MFGPQIIQQAQLVRRFAFEAFEDVRRFFFCETWRDKVDKMGFSAQ